MHSSKHICVCLSWLSRHPDIRGLYEATHHPLIREWNLSYRKLQALMLILLCPGNNLWSQWRKHKMYLQQAKNLFEPHIYIFTLQVIKYSIFPECGHIKDWIKSHWRTITYSFRRNVLRKNECNPDTSCQCIVGQHTKCWRRASRSNNLIHRMSFFKHFAVKLTIRLSSFSNFTFAGFRSCCSVSPKLQLWLCSNSISNFQMLNLKLKAFVSLDLSVVSRESNSQIPGSFAAGNNSSHCRNECRAITFCPHRLSFPLPAPLFPPLFHHSITQEARPSWKQATGAWKGTRAGTDRWWWLRG